MSIPSQSASGARAGTRLNLARTSLRTSLFYAHYYCISRDLRMTGRPPMILAWRKLHAPLPRKPLLIRSLLCSYDYSSARYNPGTARNRIRTSCDAQFMFLHDCRNDFGPLGHHAQPARLPISRVSRCCACTQVVNPRRVRVRQIGNAR